ncbi:uncharacterized protein LOC128860600 [Anastrepha ludens]|uniref:uncharacterized protein LOC128860600 n=1 Tax=Anastrepha ludens TaxID=28586 RepID=UPI0023B1426E|nr:uncharacterized protein LOC128860600 [Anastrepha ludens]
MYRFYFLIILSLCNLPLSLQDICTYCKCVHGQYADKPIWIDVGKRNEISVIGHSCGRPVVYTWKVVTGTDETLLDLGKTDVPRVIWQPFAVSVKPSNKGENNRVIVTKSDGHTKERCVCHIDFVNLGIYSHIDGARLIPIGSEQVITLDGSHSYDFGQPKGKQRYFYEWLCTPEENDMQNTYCQEGKIMSTTSRLRLDGNLLAIGGLYKITLRTKSPVTDAIGGDHIYVKVEYGTKIPLLILCHRNCINYHYIEGESMFLEVDCIGHCGESLTFYFSVDGKHITTNHNGRVKFLTPNEPQFYLNATLIADGVATTARVLFTRNDPPAGGTCTIAPASGTAGDTLFRVSCQDWTDPNLPLYYVLKAENLLYDRTTDPHWEVYVGEVSALTIRICDHFNACTKYEMPIELIPAIIPTGLSDIKKYMKREANNLQNLLHGGHFSRAVVKATLMMKSQGLAAIKHILAPFANFDVGSLVNLRQLGTMVSELIEPLGNLTSEKVEVVGEFLDKLTEGYSKVIETGEIEDMHKEELVDFSEEIITIVSNFAEKAEDFVDVQSLLWEFEGGMVRVSDERAVVAPRIAHLIEYYGEHDHLNDSVLVPVVKWKDTICKSFEILEEIGAAMSLKVHKGDEELIISEKSVQMSAFGIDDDEPLIIVSHDYVITAKLAIATLQSMQSELRCDEMTAQVVSFKVNPFWWYPTEHPLTTSVFFFSAFNREDLKRKVTKLHTPITFEMAQDRLPKEAPLIRSFVNANNEMPIYQVRAPAGAAVVINVTAVEVDMDWLVKCKKLPNAKEVRAGRQQVKASATHKGTKYTDSNDNDAVGWCYVALIAAEGVTIQHSAKYAFTVELYECLTFNVDINNPTWLTKGCVASINLDSDNISCSCHHMSIFSGRSYYSTAEEVVRERVLKDSLPTNWYVVAFYIMLILLFTWLLLRAWDDLTTSQHKKLVAKLDENERDKPCNMALRITTGGQWTAATSANVLISLPGGRVYTITQNPEQPHLKPHTTRVLDLPLKVSELKKPLKIMISQDKSGRYPSWYCESITIVDLENGEQQHCTVRKWIGDKPIAVQPDEDTDNKDDDVPNTGDANKKQDSIAHKWKKVKAAYHDVFMTWFLFQPLFGPWQYGIVKVDRFVRSCIWIAKFAVILLLVFVYFSYTDLDNYETERKEYEFLIRSLDGRFLLFILGSYLITLVVELLLLLIVYPEFLYSFKKPKKSDEGRKVKEEKTKKKLNEKKGKKKSKEKIRDNQDTENIQKQEGEEERSDSKEDTAKNFMV